MKLCYLLTFLLIISSYTLIGIDVSGNQSGTWTSVNNPYNLTGDVTVSPDDTLLINPGVIVTINGNYGFTIQGLLKAEGTLSDSIRFNNTLGNRWKGFRLENPNQLSVLRYCVITNAETAIHSSSGKFLLTNSHIAYGNRGLSLFALGNNNPPSMTIKTTKIHDFFKNGIYLVENTNTLIDSCEIYSCSVGAQYYSAVEIDNQTPGSSTNPILRNSYIHHNGKEGLTLWDATETSSVNPVIENNIIRYNMSGVVVHHGSGYFKNNDISYNFINGDSNSGSGVSIVGANSFPIFTLNTITHNFMGFYIGANARVNLGDLGNATTLDDGMNLINQNITLSSVTKAITNASSYPVKAENNSWDSTIPAIIDETIQDGIEDNNFGIVDYLPIYYLPSQLSTITGTISYFGTQNIASYSISLLDPVNYTFSSPVTINTTGTYTMSTPRNGNYYVVAKAFLANGEVAALGVYGGFLNQQTVNLVNGTTINNISLQVYDQYPDYIYSLKNPYISGTKVIFPMLVQNLFQKPSYTALLYQEGDYIKTLAYLVQINGVNDSIPVPEQFNCWQKITNLNLNDSWQSNEFYNSNLIYSQKTFSGIETLSTPVGTIPAHRIDFLAVDGHWAKQYFATGIGLLFNKICDNYLTAEINELSAYNITPSSSLFPMNAGNTWGFNDLPLPQNPSNLTAITQPETFSAVLTWDPVSTDFPNPIGYKLFQDNTLLTTLPITVTNYNLSNLFSDHSFYLTAFNQNNQTAPSNTITIPHAPYTSISNLALLRTQPQNNTIYCLTDTVTVTFYQPNPNQTFIQDHSGAILLVDPNNILNPHYQTGDRITQIFGRLVNSNNTLTFVPVLYPGNPLGNTPITPQPLSISELINNFEAHESQLVLLKNTLFDTTGNFVPDTNYPIHDSTGSFIFRTSFADVNYLGNPVPTYYQDIVAICLSGSAGNYITARTFTDINTSSVFVAPQNLQGNLVGNSFRLTWNSPISQARSHSLKNIQNRSLGAYRVFRNGIVLITLPADSLGYTDTGLIPYNPCSYYVVALYSSPDGVSEPSNTVSIPYPPVANISDLALLRIQPLNNTIYCLTDTVTVTFSQAFQNQTYIQDNTAAILMDDANNILNPRYPVGAKITHIYGRLVNNASMLTFVPVLYPGAPVGNSPLNPQPLTLSDLVNNFETYEAKLVLIKNTLFDSQGSFAYGANYTVHDSTGSFIFRTSFADVNYLGSPIPDYYQDVVAICNSNSNGNYITSRTLGDITTSPVFVAPQNLQGHLVGNAFRLTWNSPVPQTRTQAQKDAQDRSLGAYRIFRNGVVLITLPADSLGFTDNEIAPNTEYSYYVIALYASPDGVSEPSNIITLVHNNDQNNIPAITELGYNYPNPFNPSTAINYSLKNAGPVALEIFNIKGQKVKTLLNKYQSSGNHQITWNGLNDQSQYVPSGIYFLKMNCGNFHAVRKMILLK